MSLAADNAEVKNAFLKIRSMEDTHPLPTLCVTFLEQADSSAGEEAVRFVQHSVPDAVGAKCMQTILKTKSKAGAGSMLDKIVFGLIKNSAGARKYLAEEIRVSVTQSFDKIFDKGDLSADSLATLVLDVNSWPSEDERSRCEADVFQLFVAKLLETGHDDDGRALKNIARLLATDGGKLIDLMDSGTVDAILMSMDIREPLEIRTKAQMAITKYLEIRPNGGQTVVSDFITSKAKNKRNEDFILAFSAAAAIFPISPSFVASLLLTEGFLQSLVPFLQQGKSKNLQYAALDMLDAACIDRACREAISKYCTDWLTDVVEKGSDERPGMAAVILTKVKASGSGESSGPKVSSEDNNKVDQLAERFRHAIISSSGSEMKTAVEGLAYASMRPQVKETLAKDALFLGSFITTVSNNSDNATLVFGALNVLVNLTRYLPTLSEEQKRIYQLKAYADTSKEPPKPDVLDEEEHVKARCIAVQEAGIVPLIVELTKSASVTSLGLITSIFLSLSKNAKSRRVLAQQGALRTLLLDKITTADPAAQYARNAAQAVARILISAEPSLAFSKSGFPQMTTAIRPLVSLLSFSDADAGDQPRDYLPVYESLLALTNLCSSEDELVKALVVRSAWERLEDLLLDNKVPVRRATCELICNLTQSKEGALKFMDGSVRASQRIHILLALTDDDDSSTRKAAGGALAILTAYQPVVEAVLDRDRGVDLLLSMCSKDDEMAHRGVTCIAQLVTTEGQTGERAKEVVRGNGGTEVLKSLLQRTKQQAILEIGVEALKPLVQ